MEDEEIVGNSSNDAGAVHMSAGTDGDCSDISNDDDSYTSDTDDDNNDEELNALLEKNEEANDKDIVEQEPNLNYRLAQWVVKNKIVRSASDELLVLLRQNGHSDLPKCTKTLIKTPRKVNISEKCGGSYIYLGIIRGINRVIENNPHLPIPQIISLNVNIDGLPLFKSSSDQIWPILSKFSNYPVFVVALFHGKAKPSSTEEFLSDFLAEYSSIKESGLQLNNSNFPIEIKAFVCDAPARQFLKNIKGHNGYFSCERCHIEGKYEEHRITMIDTNCPLRNDRSFKDNQYLGSHQLGETVLADNGIGCVSSFVIDYMYLICLGVVKRLLIFLISGPRMCRLSQNQLGVISNLLNRYRGSCPSEFVRQPRGLNEVRRWKATEFRQFLLYTGPLVLKSVLNEDRYTHFLTLSLAMRIMLDSNDNFRNSHLSYAHELLVFFVQKSKELYGNSFAVYNVHNLIHLKDDSLTFGCSLDEISSFPFEDYLQLIKKFVRKSQSPLSQIAKRISELEGFHMKERSHTDHNLKNLSRERDAWFLSRNGDFVKIIEHLKNGMLRCETYPKRLFDNIFETPCQSSHFNMVYLNLNRKYSHVIILKKENLIRKVMALSYKDGFFLSTLRHECC